MVGGCIGGVSLWLGFFFGVVGFVFGVCWLFETKFLAMRFCDIGWGFGNVEELEGVDAFLRWVCTEWCLLVGRMMVFG